MVNRVIILGNLGADPELRQTGSGTSVCELRIATNESWFDKASNERKERVEWHKVTVWGASGENSSQSGGKQSSGGSSSGPGSSFGDDSIPF